MAFGTPLLDNFNRADETWPVGSWGTSPLIPGNAAAGVATNQAAGKSAAVCNAAWTAASASWADSEVYFTFTGTVQGSYWHFLRVNSAGVASTTTGYGIKWVPGFGAIQLYRIDAGVLSAQQQQTAVGAPVANDQGGVRILGSTICVYINDILKACWNDGTYPSAGQIGIGFADNTNTIDNFGGGQAYDAHPPRGTGMGTVL